MDELDRRRAIGIGAFGLIGAVGLSSSDKPEPRVVPDRKPRPLPEPTPEPIPVGPILSDTQRAMIAAVSNHPERPRSVEGELSRRLLDECESHSLLQARMQRQGHHNWEARFQRLVRELGGTAQEVCAESWRDDGDDLDVVSASCVNAWRYSPGHWDAVSRPCRLFGYDIQRGRNGVWYATGIFVR